LDQLTNALLAALVRRLPMHKGQKKAPGQPGLARVDHERKSRDHGAL